MNTLEIESQPFPDLDTVTPPVRIRIERVRAARAAAEGAPPRVTAMGTPCSRAWSEEWIAHVECREEKENRRICGARTAAGTPCPVSASHTNGRCRFHGGFNLTGAPKGNRNAVAHGLYARRLMVCGPHCPMWNACPCAGPDIKEMHAAERPICPYEQAQYNATITDGMSVLERKADVNPFDVQVLHLVALLEVMMSRAAAALGRKSFSQSTLPINGRTGFERPSAEMQAFTRLMWEYRQLRRLLPETKAGARPESIAKWMVRASADPDLSPEAQEELHFPDSPIEDGAAGLIDRAVEAAVDGDSGSAVQHYDTAVLLVPDPDDDALKRILEAYRPHKKTLTQEAFESYLKRVFYPTSEQLAEDEGKQDDEEDEELYEYTPP